MAGPGMTLEKTCARCGLSLRSAFNLALLREFGASTSRDPVICDDGAEHDFRDTAAKEPA